MQIEFQASNGRTVTAHRCAPPVNSDVEEWTITIEHAGRLQWCLTGGVLPPMAEMPPGLDRLAFPEAMVALEEACAAHPREFAQAFEAIYDFARDLVLDEYMAASPEERQRMDPPALFERCWRAADRGAEWPGVIVPEGPGLAGRSGHTHLSRAIEAARGALFSQLRGHIERLEVPA